MYPIRPASRATRCWRNSCARQRSLVDVYRFVAHPGIRQEKEIIATQPIEPKCIEYLRRFEATRKSEIPKGDSRPNFSARGCMQGSEQLH
jgi:hypothetical protein